MKFKIKDKVIIKDRKNLILGQDDTLDATYTIDKIYDDDSEMCTVLNDKSGRQVLVFLHRLEKIEINKEDKII